MRWYQPDRRVVFAHLKPMRSRDKLAFILVYADTAPDFWLDTARRASAR